ncbi:MAG: hypothetical protein IJ837_01170 [Clostridia bacterium]|nr:hypothetical protein [Clostridia bacterium]
MAEREPFFIGKRVEKTEQNKNGFEIVKTSKLSENKPIILCLGGQYVLSPRTANGLCKFCLNIMNKDAKNSDFDVFSVIYGTDFDDMKGNLSKDEITELCESVFISRVKNENNQKLSTEQAMKNMRQVNILSHCYGQIALNQIVDEAEQRMESLGYSKKECKNILSQCFNISYAPQIDSRNDYITTFEFMSLKDSVFNKNYESFYTQKMGKPPQFLGAGELLVDDEKNILTFITNSFLGEDEKLLGTDEHMITTLKRDENFELVEDWKNEQNRTKALKNPRTNIISMSLGFAMNLAVENSIKNQKNDVFLPLFQPQKLKSFIKPFVDEQNKMPFEKKQKNLYDQKAKNDQKIKAL